MKKQKAITLISLIITIIVLIILAGIAISLAIGKNGIFNYAKDSYTKTKEAQAREQLELALLDLRAEKEINTEYNEHEYIDNYLWNKQMIVIDDIVIVDRHQFKIDRTVPKIADYLGEGMQNDSIEITPSVSYFSDYTKATLAIEISYAEEITYILINGEELEIPEKIDGKYNIIKEVKENKTYTIYVKNEKNEYKVATQTVTQISEDVDIYTVEQLVAFRDRVNIGATYEERTIRLMNDLDLSSICYKVDGSTANDVSWIPIGNYASNNTNMFKGTFQGNNHTISNLYINTQNSYQGLFGYVVDGVITGIVIDGIKDENGNIINSIIGGNMVAGIAGCMVTSKVENCGNNASINGYSYCSGIIGNGANVNIIGSYNKGNVSGRDNCGGIVGLATPSKLEYCYNTGNITCKYYVGGVLGGVNNNYIEVYNCYNVGTVTGTTRNADTNSFVRWSCFYITCKFKS